MLQGGIIDDRDLPPVILQKAALTSNDHTHFVPPDIRVTAHADLKGQDAGQ